MSLMRGSSTRLSISVAGTLAMAVLLGLGVPQRAAAQDPFWSNAKAGYMFRSSYFDRHSSGYPDGTGAFAQEAWGVGGWLWGNTGEYREMLSFGAAYDFVLPLYGPDNRGFNYILRDPGQNAVSVLGEAWGKLRYGSHSAVLGRQAINYAWYLDDVTRYYNKLDQSMVGRRDVRAMLPIQYEAVTAQGKFARDTMRYYGGYLWRARQINDNDFRNLYQAAYQSGVWPEDKKTGDSSGAYYGGVGWRPNGNMMLEGSLYQFKDMLDMAYVDFDYVFRLADKRYVRLGTQYMGQSGNGKNLVTGGRDFSTHYWGIYGETRLAPWVTPYGMGGWTGNGEDIRSPFSIGPSYLVQRIGENSKAGERTWILGTVFDFGPFGANGLQFDMNYGQRRNRHTVTSTGSFAASDWDEAAFDLIYVFPKDGFFKNMRTRLRYAKVWESGGLTGMGGTTLGDKTQNDFRFDVGLNIPFN